LERFNAVFAALIVSSMVFTLMFETLIQNLMLIKKIKHHLLKQFDFFKFQLTLKYQTINE